MWPLKKRNDMIFFRLRASALIGVLLCAVCAFSQNDSIAAAFTAHLADVDFQLRQLTRDVLTNNPGVKAARHRVEAARMSVGMVKSLDPPQVTVDFYNSPASSFPNPLKDQGEYDYSIQQMFPFPGKLSAMAAAESNREKMSGRDQAALELDLLRDIKTEYFELYLIHRKLQVNTENRDIVRSFVAVAQQRYEVGDGRQSDILRAQTELARLAVDRIALEQERRSVEVMIGALCNKPVDPALAVIPEIEPPVPHFVSAQVTKLALSARPELASMKYSIAMYNSEHTAALRELYPDFMVRGTYKQMTDLPDYWSLMAGLSIPVAPWSLGKYTATSKRALAQAGESRERLAGMETMIVAQVRDALARIEGARQRIDLYKTAIIPQAGQSLRSTLSGYQTGKEDFGALVDAERMLREARVDYHASVADLLTGRVLLERAVGLTIEEIEKNPTQGDGP
jgi:outer membrane protein, heavy metal efflux system